jgi:hypothetical protein
MFTGREKSIDKTLKGREKGVSMECSGKSRVLRNNDNSYRRPCVIMVNITSVWLHSTKKTFCLLRGVHNGTLLNRMLQNDTVQNSMLQNGTLQNGMLQNGTLHNDTALQDGTWFKTVRYRMVQFLNRKHYKTTQRKKTVRNKKR